VKPAKEMSVGELAAFICSHLQKHDIQVVLSGGACVSIYSGNKYVSSDLDFIDNWFTKRKKLREALAEIDFYEENRYFINKENEFLIEFPSGPLSVGGEPVKEIFTLEFSTGKLQIISPTDCVKDRLAAYYHWDDRQCLEQALFVAQEREIDLQELERWSQREGKLVKFLTIKELLRKKTIEPCNHVSTSPD
jgi:hypothetical protein